jgi:hypothetical protein
VSVVHDRGAISPDSCRRGSRGRQRRGVPPRASTSSQFPSTSPAREAVRHRPRPGRDRPCDDPRRPGDVAGGARPSTCTVVVAGGRADPPRPRAVRPAHRRPDPTRMWVVEVNGRSVGFVQDYRIGDYPTTPCWRRTRRDRRRLRDRDPTWRRRGSAHGCCGRGCCGPAPLPGGDAVLRRPDHRNAASLRILARPASPRGCGSTSRRPTGPSTRGRAAPRRGARLVTLRVGAVSRHDGPMTDEPCPPAARPVDLTAHRRRATPGFDGQDEGQGGAARARRRPVRPAGAALRRGRRGSGRRRAPGAPGHGHLRQGRRAAAHRRAGRPAGRPDHVVQGAHRGGARHDFLWRIRKALPGPA